MCLIVSAISPVIMKKLLEKVSFASKTILCHFGFQMGIITTVPIR